MFNNIEFNKHSAMVAQSYLEVANVLLYCIVEDLSWKDREQNKHQLHIARVAEKVPPF